MGQIRSIAIITLFTSPCACYLARQLKGCGTRIYLFDQQAQNCAGNSWKYFFRLLRKRGVWCFVDNLLLLVVDVGRRAFRRGKRIAKRILFGTRQGIDRRPAILNNDSDLPPVLRQDPELLNEPWLNYVAVDNINSPAGRAKLAAAQPDLVLLAGAPILTRRTIELARVACLNPHCGISPQYAGNSPAVWAIYEQAFSSIGFTIHLVTPTVDGGPILHQQRIDWNPRAPIRELWPMLAQAMYDKLAEIVREFISFGECTAYPQCGTNVRPPAGQITRIIAEFRRRKFAAEASKAASTSKQPINR